MKKGIKNISDIFFRSILLVGLSVGFLAISTIRIQLSEYADESKPVEQKDQGDKNQKQDTLKAFEAIPTTAQITLDHEYLLIDVLPELVEEDQEIVPNNLTEIAGSKVLKILFQRIIPPNAP